MHALRLFCAALAVWPAAAAAGSPSLPLVFTPNRGQAHRDAHFMGKTARLNLFFARHETALEMRGAALRIQYLGADGPRQIEPAGSGSGQRIF